MVSTLLTQRIHHQQAITFQNWLLRSGWQDPLSRLDITIVMGMLGSNRSDGHPGDYRGIAVGISRRLQ